MALWELLKAYGKKLRGLILTCGLLLACRISIVYNPDTSRPGDVPGAYGLSSPIPSPSAAPSETPIATAITPPEKTSGHPADCPDRNPEGSVAYFPVFSETFSDASPVALRDSGYRRYERIPDTGPSGYLRQWEPGVAANGAAEYSRLNFSREGFLTANYSGNENGICSQDELAYPIGILLSPEQGSFEFSYRPHYDSTDDSAIMYILNSKDNINHPLELDLEASLQGSVGLEFAYSGRPGRKYFAFRMRESVPGAAERELVRLETPGEDSPDPWIFPRGKWMRIKVLWDRCGIPWLPGKTAALMVNETVLTAVDSAFTTPYAMDRWMVFGAQGVSPWETGTYYKNYSGMSGDLDDILFYDGAGW